MSTKFKNKFRNETFRAQWWDYSRNGAYFITICTQHKECYFGEIKSGKIKLTEMGQIAQPEWTKTIEIRCDMNIKMGEFVVMPNHVHGIIIIENNYMDAHRRDAMHGVPTNDTTINHFGPQSKNMASIIRGYKSAVTTYARKNSISFAWQRNYHDHIIRNDHEFQMIRDYILDNPANWKQDKFHSI
jgi:REP element-mobilizing transposase RayT